MKSTGFSFCAACIVAGTLGLAAVADDVVAYEGQPIGSIAVTAPGRSAIVAVAFKELSATDEQVSAANIVSTVNLQDGDALYIYSNGSYDAWTLENGAWTKVLKTNSEGTSEGPEAAAVRAEIGSGFWLIRNGEDRNYTKPFYIFGAAVEFGATTATKGVKSLMGNPKREAATPTISGMVNGDTIQLTTAGELLNSYTYTHYLAKEGDEKWGWGYWDEDNNPQFVASPTIPAGTGFWYVSKGTESDVTFAW
ncbi:MAG: hypothetical protein KBT68_11725 [bacterium]|nr:hypothetical protein [Candidatus Colisoma equi]